MGAARLRGTFLKARKAALDGYTPIGNGASEERKMQNERPKTDELAGDRSEFHFAEAKRLGLRPVVKPFEDVLAELRPPSRDDEDDCDDDDGPQRLEPPPEWRLEMLERLVERISNVESVKAALDADECFAVRVTCRQLVRDEELTSDDRAWDPTGSLTYHLMAPDANTARERALDRFAGEVPIKCLDHYEVTAEITQHEDGC